MSHWPEIPRRYEEYIFVKKCVNSLIVITFGKGLIIKINFSSKSYLTTLAGKNIEKQKNNCCNFTSFFGCTYFNFLIININFISMSYLTLGGNCGGDCCRKTSSSYSMSALWINSLLLFDSGPVDTGPSNEELSWSESFDESELINTNLKSLDSVWSNFCFERCFDVELFESLAVRAVFLPRIKN